MKKVKFLAFFLLISLFLVTSVFGSSCTWSTVQLESSDLGKTSLSYVQLYCTLNSNGSMDTYTPPPQVQNFMKGKLVKAVRTYPGTTTPTDSATLLFYNEKSRDLLGGKGASKMSNSAEIEHLCYNSNTGLYYYPAITGTVSFDITGNSVNAGQFYITIDLEAYRSGASN